MTAGRGIAHSEVSTADTAVLHGVQLWIALPQKAARRAHAHLRAPYAPTSGAAQPWRHARVFVGAIPGLSRSSRCTTYSRLRWRSARSGPGAQTTDRVSTGITSTPFCSTTGELGR
jgi:redox-sensitive bicupin YhaK (pirin superfamily)